MQERSKLVSTSKEHMSVHFCLPSAMDAIDVSSSLKLLPQKLSHSDVLLDKINPFSHKGLLVGVLCHRMK